MLSFSQSRDSIYIKSDIFEIVYSELLEQPKLVRYTIPCGGSVNKFSRKGMDFYKCDSIKTSDNNDYVSNIWDKGHLAPAASFNCDLLSLKSTFTYLNCSLQNQYLNRGVWKTLEAYERKLADKGYLVEVEIRCVFTESSKVLETGATVPDGFLKTINYDGRSISFFFKNEKPLYKDFNKYKIEN